MLFQDILNESGWGRLSINCQLFCLGLVGIQNYIFAISLLSTYTGISWCNMMQRQHCFLVTESGPNVTVTDILTCLSTGQHFTEGPTSGFPHQQMRETRSWRICRQLRPRCLWVAHLAALRWLWKFWRWMFCQRKTIINFICLGLPIHLSCLKTSSHIKQLAVSFALRRAICWPNILHSTQTNANSMENEDVWKIDGHGQFNKSNFNTFQDLMRKKLRVGNFGWILLYRGIKYVCWVVLVSRFHWFSICFPNCALGFSSPIGFPSCPWGCLGVPMCTCALLAI